MITATDAAANALGLSAGMPVSTAQALAPRLVIVLANPEADAASLDHLAIWIMQRLLPVVAPDPPDSIVLP